MVALTTLADGIGGFAGADATAVGQAEGPCCSSGDVGQGLSSGASDDEDDRRMLLVYGDEPDRGEDGDEESANAHVEMTDTGLSVHRRSWVGAQS